MKIPPIRSWNFWMLSLARALVILPVLLIFYLVYSRSTGGIQAIFDDAFMFLRYARNIVETGLYSWNGDQPTFGCTSVLYTWWSVLGYLMGIRSYVASHSFLMLSSLLFSALSIWMLLRILTILFPKQTNRWIWILPLLCSSMFLGNSLSGMDASMAMAALILAIWRWLRFKEDGSQRNLIIAALASYLPFLVRPDTGFYVLLFPALFLWACNQTKKIIPVYLITGSLLLTDTLIKWWYFGDPIPLPFYAKSGDYLVGYLGMHMWPVDKYWLFFLSIGSPSLLVAMLRAEKHDLKMLAAFLIPMLLTLAVLTFRVQIMGGFARFFFPSFPFLMMAGLIQLQHLRLTNNILWMLIIWAGLAFGGIFLTEYQETNVEREEQEVIAMFDPSQNPGPFEVAKELVDLIRYLPDTATVAASEHGFLSVWFPELQILDLAGLHDPEIAKKGYSDEYLERKKPDLVWMPHEDYVGMRKLMKSGAFFQSDYEYFPGIYFFGVAIRKDLPNFSRLRELLPLE